uniref:Mitotic-spindle organizing protein 2-like n=1 Tax=Sinocyclocheilus grahami TaxID=75366 RepID=A0A672KUP1_SINGR
MSQSAQPGVMPSAPDSPSLSVTVSGNVQKYSIKKKKVLNAEETELFELTQAAGIVMDQEVFKIILDLLKMNVAPLAVFQTLKTMCAGQKVSETSTGDTSTSSHTATAPSESRGEGHTCKTPPSVSVSRPPRGGAKIVVYSAGDTSAPISQGFSSLSLLAWGEMPQICFLHVSHGLCDSHPAIESSASHGK